MDEQLREMVAQAMYAMNVRFHRGQPAWDEEAEGQRAYWRGLASAAAQVFIDEELVVVPEGKVEGLLMHIEKLEEEKKPRRGRKTSPKSDSLEFEVTLEEETDEDSDS